MKKYKICFLVIVLFTVGCVPFIKPIQRVQFSPLEYEKLETEGTGIVRGQAFMKTRGGDVKLAAGNKIILNPVTSCSNQWYQLSYLQNKPLTKPDPRYVNFSIETIADADGKFEFTSVPPGEYYLVAPVFWEAATGYQGALRRQGGYLAKKIKVKNNKEYKYILTR
ncbi:MAG: carboxypeptidase regulatory-like domain-containing protein [Desulfobacterales bacterium]|nr:carboxypeptidase regulatory-like domain-containing protein [Desulfobacterales bacterium]